MKQGIFKHFSIFRKLLFFVAMFFVGSVFVSGLALVMQLMQLQGSLLLKLTQVFSAIFLFVFPAVSSAYVFSDNWKHYIYLDNPVRIDKIIYAGVMALTMQPFLSWLVYWNNQVKLPEALNSWEVWMRSMEDQMFETMQTLLATTSVGSLIVNILIIAVLTAIGEEFFFRGALQRMFSDATKKPYLAAVLIGILFSAIHMQFYGFIPRAVMGILFGVMVVQSRSLLLPITAHAVNNAYGVFMYYYCTKNDIPVETFDNPSEAPSIWIVILSVVVSALLYTSILRIIRAKNKE